MILEAGSRYANRQTELEITKKLVGLLVGASDSFDLELFQEVTEGVLAGKFKEGLQFIQQARERSFAKQSFDRTSSRFKLCENHFCCFSNKSIRSSVVSRHSADSILDSNFTEESEKHSVLLGQTPEPPV
eukprot:UN27055